MKATVDERDVSLAAEPVPSNPRSQPDGTIDEAAFSAFYRQFAPTLVAFLLWQGAQVHEAADIAQDTMIKAYQHWSQIRQPESWARKVASRELVRRAIVEKRYLVEEIPEPSSPSPPLTNVQAWEQRHEVLRLLDRLPLRQRQVMAWRLEGYTPSEIAHELEITPETVRAGLIRARRTLAEYLGPTEDVPRSLMLAQQLDEEPASDVRDESIKRLWCEVQAWGVTDIRHVPKLRKCIDDFRNYYEDRRFSQVYRPVPGLHRNRLDIILDGPDDIVTGDRKTWAENGARVCRRVLIELKKIVPELTRPGRRNTKDAQKQLRRLYRNLRVIDDYMRGLDE